jgi:glc operon protein GlcG
VHDIRLLLTITSSVVLFLSLELRCPGQDPIRCPGQDPIRCPGQDPIISRDRVRLNLAGAELIVSAAKDKAAVMKVNVNIAVVDDGGHLLAFARMDNARPASASTAITKAIAAATTRQATGPIRRGETEPDLLLNLSLQNAAMAGGGKMTSLFGGVPIVVDGQIIGAVGVGGGTGEQDAEVAKTAIERLLKELAGDRAK